MKREKISKLSRKNKFSLKNYLRDLLVFIRDNLAKTIMVLIVIAILLFALTIISYLKTTECTTNCFDNYNILNQFGEKIKITGVTLFSGIVPYMYAPVIGYLGYILQEVAVFSLLISQYGYVIGILIGIVPLILNIIAICLIGALGIYICKTFTISYKISNVKNMNFLNFRIKLHETLKKEDKVQELTKKKEEKLKKLESKKQKRDYIQILNIGVLSLVLQLVAIVILEIFV